MHIFVFYLTLNFFSCCHGAESNSNVLDFTKTSIAAIIENSAISPRCTKDLNSWLYDLFTGKKWALQMLDANGKIQSGILTGNFYQIGNYDECLAIDWDSIQGKYCFMVLIPAIGNFNSSNNYHTFFNVDLLLDYLEIPTSVKISYILKYIKILFTTCTPKSCSTDDLQILWNYVENTLHLPAHGIFHEILCSFKGKEIDPYPIDVYIYGFFTITIAIVTLATIFDILQRPHANNKVQIISLYSNLEKLLSIKDNANNLSCVNGIKVLSIFWIMLGHRLGVNVFLPNINALDLLEWKKNLANTFFYAAPLAVDSFLTISGCLLVYAKMRYSKNVSLGRFYMLRFLRLTPAVLAVILFYISVVKHLTSGPYWPMIVRKISGSCYQTWWATLFYFTNFIDIEYQCLEQSWYLSVDTQFYLISPIILFAINKNPNWTLLVNLLVCFGSMIYSYAITLKNHYGASFFELDREFFQQIYFSPLVRMPAWLIGINYGYLIYTYKSRNLRIPSCWNRVLWCMAFILMLSAILWENTLVRHDDYKATRSALHNALVRPTWALAVGFIVFSCSIGQGGVINEFLSCSFFVILSKITYSMYLTHLAVILVSTSDLPSPGYFGNMRLFRDFLGDLFFTIIASVALCLVFESPPLALLKFLENRRGENTKGGKRHK